MFTFLGNSNLVLPNNNSKGLFKFNFFHGKFSTETTITTTSILCFVDVRRKPTMSTTISSINNHSSRRDDNNHKYIYFTVSYLINSCGFTEQKAISLSKKLRLKTSSRPDSVLTLLRNNGFTDTHIYHLVQRRPLLLVADANKTLKPKIEFFNSIGLCDTELADILTKCPSIWFRSLQNYIIPSIGFLKTMVQTDTNVVKVLTRCPSVLSNDPRKRLGPKIALLQAYGVPNSNISSLLTYAPGLLLQPRFYDVVEQVKEMGFDPLKPAFISGIRVFMGVNKSLRERKFDVFKKWGWSEEEIRVAFRKHPTIMCLSDKKIMHKMDVLVKRMGYDTSLIAHCPNVLTYSLEKSIIPRCSVLQVLEMQGLVKKDRSIGTAFGLTEDGFVKKFVTKFENEVPKLLNIYQQKVNIELNALQNTEICE